MRPGAAEGRRRRLLGLAGPPGLADRWSTVQPRQRKKVLLPVSSLDPGSRASGPAHTPRAAPCAGSPARYPAHASISTRLRSKRSLRA